MNRREFLGASMVAAIGTKRGWAAPTSPDNIYVGIKAGAAQRDITPPIEFEITHFYRVSIGIHDPLFARCMYLEDGQGNSVAMICTDLITASFEVCDILREKIFKETGIRNSLIACSHSHSSVALGPLLPHTRPSKPEGYSTSAQDMISKWTANTYDAIVAIVQEAKEQAQPVSLRAGRAPAQVGFNRRLINKETGHAFMGVNREGPVVPWVNVLVADSKKTGKPIAVLFEHAAHPVIVPATSKLTSADYPGAAVKRIREELGEDVIALFGQGCGGNINGYPLRSTHENADRQGRKLGEAVLQAMKESSPIKSQTLSIKSARSMLPSHPLPSEELWQEMAVKNKDDEHRMKQLKKIRDFMDRAAEPPPRRFDAHAVMIGREWCLVTMPHEMFCQYELWIDKNAPFKHTMTFAYTNGYQGYIAIDEALRLGPKGGYEAASLPNWSGQVWSEHFGPPAVGSEKIVKDAVASLWPQG